MKILNKLTLQNIKLNKQRSIVTIVGIILSCALITALLGLIVSFQDTLIAESLNSYGNRHVSFLDVPKEDLSKIQNHKEVDSYYLTDYETVKIESKYNNEFAALIGVDQIGLQDLENILEEGNIPENKNEIVIDLYYADRYNVSIGDNITLNIGNRYSDGYKLDQYNPAIYEELGVMLETFETTDVKTYEIVGIANYYSFLGTQYDYNLYTYEDTFEGNTNIHVLYKNPKDYYSITNSINGVKSDEEQGKYNIDTNGEYLRWSGYAVSDNTREFTYILAGIIALIIIVTSVFCIRNSFAISTTEKTKMYGMLSSVGATPKQIKKSVLTEGFYLGIIGIPLGIIIGLLSTFILVNVVNALLPTLENWEFIYSISIESIIISIVLSTVTIYLSALGSAKKAAKITEIEAIKNQSEIKLKNKKMKTPKIINKIFKIGGVFAYKNMQRNKNKFRTTIISLSVSVAIFIALSYFIDLGMKTVDSFYQTVSYEIGVFIEGDNVTHEEKLNTYDEILNLGGISRYTIMEYDMFTTSTNNINKRIISNYENELEDYFVEIITVGSVEYENVLKENNLSYEDVYNKGLIINNRLDIINTEGNREWVNILKEGTTNVDVNNYKTNDKYNIDIIEIEHLPVGSENYSYSMNPVLLVSNEYFEEIKSNESYITYMYIKTDDARNLHDKIMEYDDTNEVNFYIENMEEYIEMQENMILLIGIFLYGFIGVIILISLTNIFNTITTNMKLRSKEFAILKSTGMTNKEFKNMIRLESLFYGVKALFFGLLFGLSLAYIMYSLMVEYEIMNAQNGNFKFEIPWLYVIISIIFVFLIINLIMKLSLSKINKQNIIETIKNENI